MEYRRSPRSGVTVVVVCAARTWVPLSLLGSLLPRASLDLSHHELFLSNIPQLQLVMAATFPFMKLPRELRDMVYELYANAPEHDYLYGKEDLERDRDDPLGSTKGVATAGRSVPDL